MRKIKRGQGHIETILAFGLFIGFVITVLLFFRPTIKSRDISLGTVERSLMSNLSIDFSFFSVKIPGESGCFCFESSKYSVAGKNVIVLNSSREKISAGVSGNKICINQNNAGDFFYVYLSSEFDDAEATCGTNVDVPIINIGLLRDARLVSDKSLKALKERYIQDYNEIRSELKISYDFRLAIFDNLGDKIFELERVPPLGRPVYSRDVPIEILYSNGEIQKSVMRVYAW